MRVNTWKNVDVEVEVDVKLDDCINEMLDMASEEDAPRRQLSAVDGATKVLERVTPNMVAHYLDQNPGAVQLIRQRIQKWIDRT